MNLLLFLRLSLKSEMIYKMNFFMNIVLILLFQLTRYFYIDSIFFYQNKIGTWGVDEATFALLISISISFGIETFTSSISHFCRKIYLGDADALLCKPLSPSFIYFIWRAKLSNLIISVLILILSIIFYITRSNKLFIFADFILTGIVFVLLISVNVIIFGLFSLSIFWAHRLIPVSYIYNQLYKLNIVPGSIYKKEIFVIFLLLLPTIISSSIFISAIIFKETYLIFYILFSLLILLCVFLILFKKALNVSPTHGG